MNGFAQRLGSDHVPRHVGVTCRLGERIERLIGALPGVDALADTVKPGIVRLGGRLIGLPRLPRGLRALDLNFPRRLLGREASRFKFTDRVFDGRGAACNAPVERTYPRAKDITFRAIAPSSFA